MRLLYRLWDTQEKRFHTPVYNASNGKLDDFFLMPNGDLVHRTKSGLAHESVFPGRYSVSYSTGLKDKHGHTVYGGDILKTEGDRILQVLWYEHGFCWDAIRINSDPPESPIASSELRYLKGVDFEIIGNIYEQPALLEKDVVS